MARVVIKYLSGSRTGTTEVFPTTHFESLYIGRDPSCDIQFDQDSDDLVSRSHAMIEWEGEEELKFNISDLLSSNGTFVNGERILGAVPLNSGDHIRLGQTGPELEVSLEQPRQTHQWVGSDRLEIADTKQTRVQQAVPDDKEAARAMLSDNGGDGDDAD